MTVGPSSDPYACGQAVSGDQLSTSFGLYKEVVLPRNGSYFLHLEFYLNQTDTSESSSVHNWRIFIVNDTMVHPHEHYYNIEWDTDNHLNYRFENWTIGNDSFYLTGQTIVIIIYFRDAWTSDWHQSIEFFFTDIWVEYFDE